MFLYGEVFQAVATKHFGIKQTYVIENIHGSHINPVRHPSSSARHSTASTIIINYGFTVTTKE